MNKKDFLEFLDHEDSAPQNEEKIKMEEVASTSILVPFAERSYNWKDARRKDQAWVKRDRAIPHVTWAGDLRSKK